MRPSGLEQRGTAAAILLYYTFSTLRLLKQWKDVPQGYFKPEREKMYNVVRSSLATNHAELQLVVRSLLGIQ